MKTLFSLAVRWASGIKADQWKYVLSVIVAAGKSYKESADKKAWALKQLDGVGIKGSVANFLVEAAVTYGKKFKLIPA